MSAVVAQPGSRTVSPFIGSGILIVLATLSGCDSGGSQSTAPGTNQPAVATAVQHPLLQNIPVPAGFRLMSDRSVASISGSTRVAKCEFQGGLSPDEVVRFYESLMPTVRFTLGPKSYDNGQYSMRFESETEECTLRIKRAGSKTVLVIDLRPLSKGSAEGEAQPPVRR